MISQQTLKGNLLLQDYTTAFTLNQGDKGVPFKVELLENGTPYTLQSTDIVTIEWLKPNGNPFLQEGDILYGTTYIEFTTPEAISQSSGSGTFNIIISNNNVRKGTIRREYKIVPTSMKPGSVSEDTITDAITELRELSVEIADTVQNNQDLINNNQAATKQDIANVNSSLEDITNDYAKKTEVNSLASSKAEKTDLEKTNTNVSKNATDIIVQTARIDALSSLSSGSTTGDAELIDGRVGMDGITYNNIGNAIRLQLNGKLDGDINNNIIYWEEGAYDSSGNKISTADTTHTRTKDFLPSRLEGINNKHTSAICLLVFDSSNTFEEVVWVSSGKIYMFDKNKKYKAHIENPFFTFNIGDIVFLTSPNKYDTLISDTRKDVGISELAEDTSYTNISVKSDGIEATYTGWYTSGYRRCNGYKYLIVEDVAFFENPVLNAISFYDENKNFISGLYHPNIEGIWFNGYKKYNGTIEIPENAYYFRDGKYNYNSKESTNVIKVCNFSTPITEIPKLISNIQNKIDLGKILCIGDSLTEGDYGSNPAGTMNVKSENYPYYLDKFLNKHYTATVVNAGKCGYTATTYWESKVKTIDFTNVKVIVIMLGTNGYLTDTVDADTTITDGQTYEDYANTHTGNYCKIIEYCLEQTENKAQIFLVTPPKTSARDDDKMKLTGEVVKKIGEKYSLKVLDGRNEFGISSCNFSTMLPIDGLHGGKLAYKKIGTYVGSNIISNLSYEIED